MTAATLSPAAELCAKTGGHTPTPAGVYVLRCTFCGHTELVL